GVDLRLLRGETADEVLALPDRPLRVVVEVKGHEYVECVADEVGRRELEGVAGLAVGAQAAPVDARAAVQLPVVLARARALPERVEAGRYRKDAVAAQDAVVVAGRVDV